MGRPCSYERRRRSKGSADRDAASRRRQVALATIDTAIGAGFALRAPGNGSLDILTPVGMASEIRETIVNALTTYKPEVAAILEAADDGRGMAQVWVTPRRGRLQ